MNKNRPVLTGTQHEGQTVTYLTSHDVGDGSISSRDGGNPASPFISRYISRRHSSRIKSKDLPMEESKWGMYTPAGLFFASVKLTVPLAYSYIAAYVVRDVAVKTDTLEYVYAVPILCHVVTKIENFPVIVHLWAIIEAIFYVCLFLHVQWLQYQCPLEASLSSAPMQEPDERRLLFDRILECERDDPVTFLTGWFFDAPLRSITRYDMLDFLSWCLFEGRNQEHLTEEEVVQLNGFVRDVEYCLSVHLHGSVDDVAEKLADGGREEGDASFDPTVSSSSSLSSEESSCRTGANKRLRPRKRFKFSVHKHDAPPTFFTNLYEHVLDNYKSVVENERVQDLRKYVSETTQRMRDSEQSAIAAAGAAYANCRHRTDERMQDFRKYLSEKRRQIHTAEESAISMASDMYENAYFTLVEKGSNVDKCVNSLTHAKACLLAEAWHRVVGVKERLEIATCIAERRKRLRHQLASYRLLLDRMRSTSSSISSRQMADLLRKITRVNDALSEVETVARDAFSHATGYAVNLLPRRKEPLRYAKYSSDPLFDVSTYPLVFHLLILSVTEGGLRLLLRQRGFERRKIGPISYYYCHGEKDDSSLREPEETTPVPVVFCHGIGIGLIYYLSLIDELLSLGRSVLLPEIPYVTGFRSWQTPNSILPPHEVSSTLTAMLYECGFRKAAFVGHSYGTTWLSYMCKLAPDAMTAAIFLDPICFCLHIPFLTKRFVYHRADPGSTSYMIRTDVIINWTIQRGFPWARVALYVEELPVQTVVFLSGKDNLVPTGQVMNYLRSKGSRVESFPPPSGHFGRDPISVTVFEDVCHGDWAFHSNMVHAVGEAVDELCNKKHSAPSANSKAAIGMNSKAVKT